ncbi:NAD(P)-dependent oxidoreductase [Asanoa sp. WMMD1127]|uniref:NAD-dependent epimerase/dehydratase family protein n=1 Tax=Asanoa sp. WMMD1127 TaxID=3016107 RepID=UPI002417BDF6|nr:NAD(P)-dependent oxidoreductase [Asanoa sp. WMMD1127]MDG4825218.1 NAD(P)-dependent oxidoreductase [Asanoa sp. WMMD1127]
MTVLITGAAGGVATALLPGLADLDLRLTDRAPGTGFVVGDLCTPGFARAVCDGVDAVVHLAADPDPAHGWERLRGPNADAVVAMLEACAAVGVPRLVLASSLHAVGGYRDQGDEPIPDGITPFPCCTYGATKAFAEALGHAYAQQWDMRVVCLRLGGVAAAPPARSWLPGWLSHGDLIRLVRAALTADVNFGVFSGTSANTPTVFGLDATRATLGYAPVDDAAAYAATVPDDTPPAPDPAARPRWGLLHRS